jgi:hypothetical protein
MRPTRTLSNFELNPVRDGAQSEFRRPKAEDCLSDCPIPYGVFSDLLEHDSQIGNYKKVDYVWKDLLHGRLSKASEKK